MKKILVVLVMMVLGGCYTEYYIPLSDDCMEAKIAEIKRDEMKKANVRGRSFVLMYDEFSLKPRDKVKDGEILPVYVLGKIKFDKNLKVSFEPAVPFKEFESYKQQQKINEKVQEIVDGINANKYIETVYMRPFDIDCYSGGGSVKVPYWLIEQEVKFKAELKDPLFLAAFDQYLRSQGRYMNLVIK